METRERDPGRVRAGVLPVAGSAGRAIAPAHRLPDFAALLGARLAGWAATEVAPGRLFPWLPVAFGLGIVLYFTAEREPALWAAGAAFAAAAAAVIATRRHGGVAVALGFAALAAGFLAAGVRAQKVDAPVLRKPLWGATLTGFVERREERERSDRIVVRIHTMEGRGLAAPHPTRVRVAVRKGTAPPVGAFVAMKARLSPPLAPMRPGGYDFARDLYFQGIGAVGFALGRISVSAPPVTPDFSLRAVAAIDRLRSAIDARIRASVPGDSGAIASALITGQRDAISRRVNDAMYVSSLAHVLSISGYHMAVVVGVVFVGLRAVLALVPGLALRRPIKSYAAAAALLAAAFYLVLSGAEVATRRAFVMTAIVLVGVIAGRRALTLRTLSIAAFAVMLLSPEAVVHPSFQMSFAATLALVAAYEHGLPWMASGGKTALGARLALWGAREIFGLLVASLVAGFATTLFAAYHFHRLAPYGVVANLLVMPVVSAFVMPMGLAALAALPFGFDGPLWRAMGYGIDWMTGAAVWVADLPGAVGRVAAFGTGPLLVGTLGLVLLALLRSPLRWSGAAVLALAVGLMAAVQKPDALIAADGGAIAVRGADGRLAVARAAKTSFAVREWLSADADARAPDSAEVLRGVSCDPAGCVARLADGTAVALAKTVEAFADDCARAALIVARREPPPGCRATVIGRDTLRRYGALALYRTGAGWAIVPAREKNLDRPWASADPALASVELPRIGTGTTAREPSPPSSRATPAGNSPAELSGTSPDKSGTDPAVTPDATPLPDDLDADD
ncbi:Competence protein [Rhodovulum sp. PH10]|uniref:ComEC/Rec2 family competence protein n=1 Tax=Rhodovulum sp. PH10 TaxID=1187851 RepID=UPI00027C27A6|nr:ComEC/Rec2 family competence protein [Rhodovulum sp. PH10]EJW12173.1 Competence protein [Rhodovulum sp. PH10]